MRNTKTRSFLRQIVFLKRYKNGSVTTNIKSKQGLLHFYRQIQDLIIKESNQKLYYIQKPESLKICLSFSLLHTIFQIMLALEIPMPRLQKNNFFLT